MQNGGNQKNRFRKLVSTATAIGTGTVSPYIPHPPHAQLSHLLTTQCRPQLQVNISQQLKANSRNHSRQKSF